ncbi:MAG: ABC transporter permease [Firmicutes bacterium]|nr:ABC transporter permease [Bacillota bacterium]MCL5039569.1 ABC transporter permease [Bacillota bacterium]
MTPSLLTKLKNGLSLSLIILLVLVWELTIQFLGLKNPPVPAPSQVLVALFEARLVFLTNLFPTLAEAAGGFFLGNLIAVATAMLFVRHRAIEETFYPLAVVLHSIPLMAIIPLLIIWFGPGYASKVALTTLVSFFPGLVNTVKGLKSVNPQALELMEVWGARGWTVFWKVRLPSALPYIFAGLKIAAPASVLGAVVAEWIGSRQGIGFLMLWEMFNYNPPRLWGAMVISAGVTMLSFWLLSLVERLAIPWHESVQQTGGAPKE